MLSLVHHAVLRHLQMSQETYGLWEPTQRGWLVWILATSRVSAASRSKSSLPLKNWWGLARVLSDRRNRTFLGALCHFATTMMLGFSSVTGRTCSGWSGGSGSGPERRPSGGCRHAGAALAYGDFLSVLPALLSQQPPWIPAVANAIST